MTCVAIETLAQIAFSFSYKGTGFKTVLSKLHPLFSTPLSDTFKEQLSGFILSSEPDKEVAKIKTYGDLLYSYFRNTMFHGYRATGVFLDHLLPEMVVAGDGFLVLNPMTFWSGYKSLFAEVFDDLANNTESVYREQCGEYLERMLA